MEAQKKSTLYFSTIKKKRPSNCKSERLFYSISHGGNVLTIQDLLQEGANIEARELYGCTPLLVACFHRRKEIVHLLIKNGAKIYAKDYRGDAAMHFASISGCLKVVKCLMKKGANIDKIDFVGFTPLLFAAKFSKKEVFDHLLNSGANIKGNERLLLYFASVNGWTETVQSFVKRVPYLNKRYVMGKITLDATSSSGHLKLVKCLLKKRTNINREVEMIRQEALNKASSMGHLEVVKWIVKKGAMKKVPILNAKEKNGDTALHLASQEGHLEIVKYLVEEGADVNIRNEHGIVPLHSASLGGNLEVVKWFMEKVADINVKTCLGNTPLICAALRDNIEVVKLLMFSGRNVDIPKIIESRCTMLHWATSHGCIEIAQSLVEQGYDLEARDIYGRTALGYACVYFQLEIVQVLLQAGANWDVVDNKGESLLQYLAIKKNPELIKLFIENGAYLKPAEYYAIVKSSSLKVLQDARLCRKAIVNKFNNHNLPQLYKVLASGSLPRIESMKIASNSEVAQAIERTVGFDIRTNGHCNILEAHPMMLGLIAVRSFLEYYEKSSELKNRLKRPATFESVSYQHSSKLMRFT